jgi:hypothetical protein
MTDRRDSAHVLAIKALGWLAARDDLFEAFLTNSGASASDVRENAASPAFLCGALDFVLMQDQWVLDCAGALATEPQSLVEARAILGGGDMRHWT